MVVFFSNLLLQIKSIFLSNSNLLSETEKESLMSLEKLDRSSPDLWPEQCK